MSNKFKHLKEKFLPTGVIQLNFLKLAIRSLLFVAALVIYLAEDKSVAVAFYEYKSTGAYLLIVIWLFFMLEMLARLFPSSSESLGCQKQFGRNYIPGNEQTEPGQKQKRKYQQDVIVIIIVWVVINAGVGLLCFYGIIDEWILLLISLFYAVSDVICILFYCPFQSLIMKNRCCVTCRIYNWDFIMMFTPMIFIKSFYSISLFAISLLIFIKWEVDYVTHPERFFEETNARLSCNACSEKLCSFKKNS